MRLRLIIPAALAAAATYAAIVRDEERLQVALPDGQPLGGREAVARQDAPAAAPPPVAPRVVAGADSAPATHDETEPDASDAGASAPLETRPHRPEVDATAAEAEWTEMEGIPVLSEPAAAQAAVEPVPEGPVLDEGRFAIGGWAAAPGHSVVSAVTYHQRLPIVVPAERVVLTVDAAENVPERGLVVLADPGFAPDREGFTLLLAAADPGPFSAAGSYRVIG